jgi:hypothetical protein
MGTGIASQRLNWKSAGVHSVRGWGNFGARFRLPWISEAAMNTTSSDGTYDPATLALLSRVLEESFMILVNGTAILDPEWQKGARHRLAQVIIAQFRRGERDPEVLKRIAVERVTPAYKPGPEIE